MVLSQELQFILQSLIASLPVLLVSLGLLVLAIVRRKDAKVPANYAIVGILLITLVQIVRLIVSPNLPRLLGFFVPGESLVIALAIIHFAFNSVYALGLLLLGVAVFVDRNKW